MPQTSVFGRGAMRTLAALLLVDGRVLTSRELALIASPWIAEPDSVRGWWIPKLRAAGCRIEAMPPSSGGGYRLVALPPDALLDDVLAVAHALKREHPTRLWELFGRAVATSLSPEMRSSASSARRSDDGHHVLAGHRTA
jgi:hypothetical protein